LGGEVELPVAEAIDQGAESGDKLDDLVAGLHDLLGLEAGMPETDRAERLVGDHEAIAADPAEDPDAEHVRA
jgi:hypothetical protein